METIYYSVETKPITVSAGEEEKVSGAAGEVRCVVVPRRKRAAGERKKGVVVEMAEYRRRGAGPAKAEPVEAGAAELEDGPEETRESRRAAFGLLLDLCATAAIVAVCVLAAIRFLAM